MTKHSARRCAADERFGTGSARVKDRLGKDYGRGGNSSGYGGWQINSAGYGVHDL